MTMGIDWRQQHILADRYLEIICNDWGNTFLLLAQAPAIAALVILRWQNAPLTPSLYFILTISAVWFGCINACRELVKERPVYRRERLVNLDIGSYLLSKVQILAMLGFIQCLLLLGLVHHYIHLRGNLIFLFLTLFLTSCVGTALGLFLSALVNNSDQAVGLAPLVTIPQILFSKFILAQEFLKGIPALLEKMTIVKWAWEAFEEITSSTPMYNRVVWDFAVLAAMGAVLLSLTWLALRATDRAEI